MSISLNTMIDYSLHPFRRLGLPQSPPKENGVQMATSFGAACPQQSATNLTTSEDCLFVNVIKPSNIPHNAKLPIVFVRELRMILLQCNDDGSHASGSTVVGSNLETRLPLMVRPSSLVPLHWMNQLFMFRQIIACPVRALPPASDINVDTSLPHHSLWI